MTIYLNALGMACPLGQRHDIIRERLLRGDSGVLAQPRGDGSSLALGSVDLADAALPNDHHLPLAARSRNNRLALAALAQIRAAADQAIARFGAHRVAVVIGTSTSGIAESETAFARLHADGALPADFHYSQQELGSPAAALAATLGLSGPAYVHSSACASSGKAMASAARLLNMGVCDAVLCGGVDTLCDFTVAGFMALESVSAERCNPMSAHRHGINIGEGAALFLMSRERPGQSGQPTPIALLGWGESSDAHHISAPDPEGGGARLAIGQALARAGCSPAQIDYINLHGTATPQNDAMEARAVHALFGATVPASSTKPLTGHALGAASAIEAGLCWLAMQDDNRSGQLPPHLWDGVADPALPALDLVAPGRALGHPPRRVLSNSFAFGGSNVALVLGRMEP